MNVNVVCPHCFKVNRLPKKESYAKANCGECKTSFLDSKPPCLQMAAHFEKAALAMPLKAQFIKINNDNEQSLGAKYQIASIPCVLVFKEGKEVDRFTGARDSRQIEDWVRKYV